MPKPRHCSPSNSKAVMASSANPRAGRGGQPRHSIMARTPRVMAPTVTTQSCNWGQSAATSSSCCRAMSGSRRRLSSSIGRALRWFGIELCQCQQAALHKGGATIGPQRLVCQRQGKGDAPFAVIGAPPGKHRQPLLQIPTRDPLQGEVSVILLRFMELFGQQAAPLGKLFPGDPAQWFTGLMCPQGIKVTESGRSGLALMPLAFGRMLPLNAPNAGLGESQPSNCKSSRDQQRNRPRG